MCILQGGDPPKFIKIAAMYSELLAIGANGQMHQWKWNEAEPYKHAEVSLPDDDVVHVGLKHELDAIIKCLGLKHELDVVIKY